MNSEQNEQLDRFEQHFRVIKGLQASSVAVYRKGVAEFLTWREKNALTTPISSLEPLELRKQVETYLNWCYHNGNGNSTRRRKLTAIQNFIRHLVYERLLAVDPTEEIPRPPMDSAAMIPFTRSEVLGMFRAIDITTEMGIRDAVFLIMGVFAGFRVSEITKFNIEDVLDEFDRDRRRPSDPHRREPAMNLSIPKTKKKRYRIVWIWKAPAHYVRALLLARISQGARVGDPLLVSYNKNGEANDGLRSRCRRCDRLEKCPAARRRQKENGYQRLTSCACDDILKKLARRAGVRKAAIKTHMLRATHACDARHIRGYDTFNIMERFGWKNPETAARYITRRDSTYRLYNNWHEYWIDFTKVWTIKTAMIPGTGEKEFVKC